MQTTVKPDEYERHELPGTTCGRAGSTCGNSPEKATSSASPRVGNPRVGLVGVSWMGKGARKLPSERRTANNGGR